MKTSQIIIFITSLTLNILPKGWAAEPWPAEPWSSAKILTHLDADFVDRKSLFRRLGHSPREVVLESGFMGKGVVEAGVFVKDGGLPLRGMPRTGRYDRQKDKTGPF